MSLWGYTTNVDLSRWSTFLMVGLIGVVIASLVNLFIGSSMLQLVFSIAGVLVFTGLTAWDTQRLKSEYLAYAGNERADKRSEEHTSELQSLMRSSYAVFSLKKKKQTIITINTSHT